MGRGEPAVMQIPQAPRGAPRLGYPFRGVPSKGKGWGHCAPTWTRRGVAPVKAALRRRVFPEKAVPQSQGQ